MRDTWTEGREDFCLGIYDIWIQVTVSPTIWIVSTYSANVEWSAINFPSFITPAASCVRATGSIYRATLGRFSHPFTNTHPENGMSLPFAIPFLRYSWHLSTSWYDRSTWCNSPPSRKPKTIPIFPFPIINSASASASALTHHITCSAQQHPFPIPSLHCLSPSMDLNHRSS